MSYGEIIVLSIPCIIVDTGFYLKFIIQAALTSDAGEVSLPRILESKRYSVELASIIYRGKV